MSNIKRVKMTGSVPFNLIEHSKIAHRLAAMNSPCFGLKITYGNDVEYRPNAYGGKTSMYFFTVKGEEAVSASWVQTFAHEIHEIGGLVHTAEVLDIENNERYTIRLTRPQLPIVPKFGSEI